MKYEANVKRDDHYPNDSGFKEHAILPGGSPRPQGVGKNFLSPRDLEGSQLIIVLHDSPWRELKTQTTTTDSSSLTV